MKTFSKSNLAALSAASILGLVAAASTAQAESIRVTVENLSSVGGFSLTPVYLGLHDGSFDLFDVGDFASPGLQVVAEEGGPFNAPPEGQGVVQERLAADPDSFGAVVAQPDGFAGAPVIEPGEIGSVIVEFSDPTDQRFLTYVSMVIATNDAFIGNAQALELFDDAGNFLGNQDILITGLNIYDAGTEVNDIANGPAFVAGQPRGSGADENEVIQRVIDRFPGVGLNNFAGLVQVSGEELLLDAIDFVSDPGSFQLARISITRVPEPGSFALLGAGMIALGGLRRKPALA